MKGHYEFRADGRMADAPPCRTCKHKNKMTVEAPCYSCIDPVALALHKPNAETEFTNYEPEGEEEPDGR